MGNISFVNLHVHDNGSVGDAIGFPKDLADYALSRGMRSIAITNHGNANSLASAVIYSKQLAKEGKEFSFIYGVEAYFVDSLADWRLLYEERNADKASGKKKKKGDLVESEEASVAVEDEEETKNVRQVNPLNKRYHLVLLAKNAVGLSNIFRLISKSYERQNYYRFPRIDYEMLRFHSEGVVCLSACMGSRLSAAILNDDLEDAECVVLSHKAIFGNDYFLELQWNAIPEQHKINQAVIRLAKKHNIRLVSSVDVHFPRPELWQTRELYKRLSYMSRGAKEIVPLPETSKDMKYMLYPKTGEEMFEAYQAYSAACGVVYDDSDILESFANTAYIAENVIEKYEVDTSVSYPSFVVEDGLTDVEMLRKKAKADVERLFSGKLNAEYQRRLEYELEVIEKKGFAKYFLLMQEIIKENNKQWRTGSARGSAAGSLLSYLLEITQVDPIKYGLLFERFLDPDSDGFPDIDVDVSEPMLLKELLAEKWKREYGVDVIPVSNFTTFQIRNLLKDVSKYYNVPFEEVNNVTNVMLDEAIPKIKEKRGIKTGVLIGEDAPTTEEVVENSETLQRFLRKYPHVAKQIENLQGQVRGISRHAGGIILGERLEERMPIIMSSGVRQTPWAEGIAMRQLEPMGFLKFDVLGLATLRTVQDTIVRILETQGVENPSLEQINDFYEKELHPRNLNFDDQAVWENIFHQGRFLGVFQFSQKPVQSFCRSAQPRNIDELSAVTSIFRPGPLAAEFDKEYLHYRSHPEEIEYIHPLVEQNLKNSMGMVIYQEDITKLVCSLGKDISFAEGNKLRKVLVKKGIGKNQEFKEKIRTKFLNGCMEKKIASEKAEELWQVLENTAQYLFNRSHAVSYSIISYTCAYLLNYYPEQWVASFLEREQDDDDKKTISLALAKNEGFTIKPPDINLSGSVWKIDSMAPRTLISPLSGIKGVGDAALEEIIKYRPFRSIEELIFHSDIDSRKLNKRVLDVLLRGGALNSLKDDRFKNLKHFWSSVVVNKPANEQELADSIEAFKDVEEFTRDERIQFKKELTGLFPVEMVVSPKTVRDLYLVDCPPAGEYEAGVHENIWFIPTSIEIKTSAKGKKFMVIKTIDSSYKTSIIRVWNIYDSEHGVVQPNKLYIAHPNYNEKFGFSLFGTKGIKQLGR